MDTKKIAEIIYYWLDKLDDEKKLGVELDTISMDNLTREQIFIETKEHKKFQIIVVPTEMDF